METTCFDVVFLSDCRYEKLTAEISFSNQILCQINKDKGTDKIEIEFFTDFRILNENPVMKFYLDDFIKLLQEVKEELIIS